MNENLTESDIKYIISTTYGIEIEEIEKVKNSSTDCYFITSNNKKYFIKIFNKRKDANKIEQEYYLVKYLKEKGFRVPTFIRSKENNIFTPYKEHYIVLEDFLEGYCYADDDIPKSILLSSSSLLGSMHDTLKDRYDDPNKEKIWTSIDTDLEYAFLDNVTKMLSEVEDNENTELIRKAINHKRLLVPKLIKLNDKFSGITYAMTHGDYCKRNFLSSSDGLILVDFSDSDVYPVSWELFRSFIFSTEAIKNGNSFDYQLFNEYVNKYCEHFPLTDKDISVMPEIFLYQILVSRYGYREYLNTGNDSLIDFIRWKDDIITFLDNNSEEIVKKLVL